MRTHALHFALLSNRLPIQIMSLGWQALNFSLLSYTQQHSRSIGMQQSTHPDHEPWCMALHMLLERHGVTRTKDDLRANVLCDQYVTAGTLVSKLACRRRF